MRRSEFDRLAKAAQAEIEEAAPELARRLLPEPPGMVEMPRSHFLEYVRQKWPDVGFRQELLRRVGARNFLDVTREAWGISQRSDEVAQSQSVE